MDKQEYREFLDEIKLNYYRRNYELVSAYADDINLRKLKDNKVLEMISDSYAQIGSYDKARAVLEDIYAKTATKQMAFTLCELCLKDGDIDGAIDYYEDFCKIGSSDNRRFILKYEIGRAGNVPVTELIKVLEEYNRREKDDKWEYELAQLYHEAGYNDKCVELCDDIYLWFADGDYVKKALQLKSSQTALTNEQQIRYEELLTGITRPAVEIEDEEESSQGDTRELELEAESFASEFLGEKKPERRRAATVGAEAGRTSKSNIGTASSLAEAIAIATGRSFNKPEPEQSADAGVAAEVVPEAETGAVESVEYSSQASVSENNETQPAAKPVEAAIEDDEPYVAVQGDFTARSHTSNIADTRFIPIDLLRDKIRYPGADIEEMKEAIARHDSAPEPEKISEAVQEIEAADVAEEQAFEEPVPEDAAEETEQVSQVEAEEPEAQAEETESPAEEAEIDSEEVSETSAEETESEASAENTNPIDTIAANVIAIADSETPQEEWEPIFGHPMYIRKMEADQVKAEARAAEQAKAEAEALEAEKARAEAEALAAERARAEAEALAAERARAEEEALAAEQSETDEDSLDVQIEADDENIWLGGDLVTRANSGVIAGEDSIFNNFDLTEDEPEEIPVEDIEPEAVDINIENEINNDNDNSMTQIITGAGLLRGIQEKGNASNETAAEATDIGETQIFTMPKQQTSVDTALELDGTGKKSADISLDELKEILKPGAVRDGEFGFFFDMTDTADDKAEEELDVFEGSASADTGFSEEEDGSYTKQIKISKASAAKIGRLFAELSPLAAMVTKPELYVEPEAEPEPEPVIPVTGSKLTENADISGLPLSNESDGQVGLNLDLLTDEHAEGIEGQMTIDEVFAAYQESVRANKDKIAEVEAERLRKIQEEVNSTMKPTELYDLEEDPVDLLNLEEEDLFHEEENAEAAEAAKADEADIEADNIELTEVEQSQEQHEFEAYEELSEQESAQLEDLFADIDLVLDGEGEKEPESVDIESMVEDLTEAAPEQETPLTEEEDSELDDLFSDIDMALMGDENNETEDIELDDLFADIDAELSEDEKSEDDIEEENQQEDNVADEEPEEAEVIEETPVSEDIELSEEEDSELEDLFADIDTSLSLDEAEEVPEEEQEEVEPEEVPEEEQEESEPEEVPEEEQEEVEPEEAPEEEQEESEPEEVPVEEQEEREPEEVPEEEQEESEPEEVSEEEQEEREPEEVPVDEEEEDELAEYIAQQLGDKSEDGELSAADRAIAAFLSGKPVEPILESNDTNADEEKPESEFEIDESEDYAEYDNEDVNDLDSITLPKDEPAIKEINVVDSKYTLSDNIRKEISELLLIDGMEEQFVQAVEEISEKKIKGDTSGGNLIVTGDAKTGKTYLAVEIVKAVTEELGIGSGRIATVQAEALNGKDIDKVFAKIIGNDLVIENVGYLEDETIQGLVRNIRDNKSDGMVIIEGNQIAVDNILRNFPEMRELFASRVDINELSIVEWGNIASDYAKDNGYKLDDMAVLALHAKINEINVPTRRLGYENITKIMDAAIAKAEKRNTGKLFSAFSKKNGETLKEITEADFN